jgi:hypothetical protein
MTESLIPGLLELAAFLGTSWVVARWVDWVYRGNQPDAVPAERPGAAASALTRS